VPWSGPMSAQSTITYVGFLTPPDDQGAALGVLFWHKDGFSTACGHGTMALGVWAVESGLVRHWG
jgi:proline racemase